MNDRGRKLGLKPWKGERTLRTGQRMMFAADLSYSDMRRGDLRDLRLENASLASANLANVRLDRATLTKALLVDAQLQGASLQESDLQCTTLDHADLNGASLDYASLQGASLRWAQFQSASLNFAELQGASLDFAELQGASLDGVRLEGASFIDAKLKGALLTGVVLQGTSLFDAKLQGASLDLAQFQGASLDSAQLQGASLNGAQLQGASLNGAFVYRATGLAAKPAVGMVKSEKQYGIGDFPFLGVGVPLTDSVVDSWIAEATQNVANPDRKHQIEQRLARLKSDGMDADENQRLADFWKGVGKVPFDAKAYTDAVRDRICADDSKPHVARGMMRNGVLSQTGEALEDIKEEMRSNRDKIDNCPGVAGFTDADWAALDEVSPPPK